MKLDKTNQRKEKSPRRGRRTRELLLRAVRNPTKRLNWKPCHDMYTEDLVQTFSRGLWGPNSDHQAWQ